VVREALVEVMPMVEALEVALEVVREALVEVMPMVEALEVALEVVREALVEVMPMVEALEVVMDMVEVVDAGAGTMEEDLDRMAARMVEDLVWDVEVEVVEEVACRVDQGGVGTLLL